MAKLTKRENLLKEVKKYFETKLCVDQPHNYEKQDWKIKKGKAFEEWLTHEVFGKILGITDVDDLNESYDYGSHGEKTCDIVLQPTENELHIFECKFTEKKESIDNEWIPEICSIANWIDDPETIDSLPTFAKEKIRDFDLYSESSSVTVYLISSHHMTDTSQAAWDTQTRETIAKSKIKNLQFKFYTHSKVWDEWGRAQGNLEPIDNNFKLKDLHTAEDRVQDLSQYSPQNIPMYSAIVRGTEIVDWVKQNDAIFHENIRGYRGQNAVNAELIETIASEPENFLIYNNGITATASKIHDDGTFLNCARFQIINGCQTASTLRSFDESTRKLKNGIVLDNDQKQKILKQLRVQVRILDVGQGDENKITKTKLIKANNTQTPITASDFRSTDEVQIHIENTINNNKNKKYYYAGASKKKVVFYKRKVGTIPSKTNTQIVKLTDLAESVFTYEINPHEMNANRKSLYSDEIGSNYWKIFGINGDKTKNLTTDRIEQMLAEHFLWLHVKSIIGKIVKDLDKDSKTYQYFLPKRHYFSIIGHLLRHFKIHDSSIKGLLNGSFYNDSLMEDICFEIQEAVRMPFVIAEQLGKAINARNWQRSETEYQNLLENHIMEPGRLRKLEALFKRLSTK